jgi:hypothetical protein
VILPFGDAHARAYQEKIDFSLYFPCHQLTFRGEFKRVRELLNQKERPGGLAILTHKDRFIYYLVTKCLSSDKPTYSTLFSSLKKLRGHVTANDVKKLAMPRIGCGLDRQQWEEVKFMIEFVFAKVDVEIVVCNLEPVRYIF